jgi:Mn-containing catalase
LLNVVAVTEWRAHQYLGKWLEATSDPTVRAALRIVVAREGEHGMAFAKRISELGFDVRETPDAGFQARLDFAGSTASDLEKMEEFGIQKYYVPDGPDVFDDWFKDHSIDIRTAELLGRHIAEERDSFRLINECYQALKAREAVEARA